jgi:deoxyribodipyrimidine photo-lyase
LLENIKLTNKIKIGYTTKVKNIIVWFRNDLRLMDNPALIEAINNSHQIIPLFILDSKILKSPNHSSNRNRFLFESLRELDSNLKKLGGKLILRNGNPKDILLKICKEFNSNIVYYSQDYTPFAIQRDGLIDEALKNNSIETKKFPGRLAVDRLDDIKTQTGNLYKVFTPFCNTWLDIKRRQVLNAPNKISMPENIISDLIPKIDNLSENENLSPKAQIGGENKALERLNEFLKNDVKDYKEEHNMLADDRTSRLSAYLHFGCISPRYIESRLGNSEGEYEFRRQLCWRDFYNYILNNFPNNINHEFQEKYQKLKWNNNKDNLQAWKDGKTGYPIVDAAMRQLKLEGWMHNRGRLIVGSFLTKDLFIDWREGESYFQKMLIDADTANNNGNWQWIASVGVDPAPVFRRIFNPSLQQEKFDPDGIYIKKYIPELKNIPTEYLADPEQMPIEIQKKAGCIIGQDYPNKIIDHNEARKITLNEFSQVNKQL